MDEETTEGSLSPMPMSLGYCGCGIVWGWGAMRDLDGGLREYDKLGIQDDGTQLEVFEY